MLEYTNKKEGKYMTDLELKKAIETYRMQLEGQQMLLESVASKAIFAFTSQYFSNVSEESIQSISKDEILRKAFLSTFGNTKESSNLVVSLNYIQKVDATLSDGQPELVSIHWKYNQIEELLRVNDKTLQKTSDGLNIYNLYCDLETNRPFLIGVEEQDFLKNVHKIFIPFKPTTETYHYNSKSLEKITKGSATKSFNRLQLYYFRLLLDSSREEAVTRIRKLTSKELEEICLDKDDIRIYK